MPVRWIKFCIFVLGLGLIVWLAFTGNYEIVDPLNVQDETAVPAGDLVGGTIVGQTFVARSPRLSAIQVRWIVSDDFSSAPDSRVTLHLRQRVDDSTDLAAASVPLSQVQPNQFSTFYFPPIADSDARRYYFFLDVSQVEITRGWLSVWASDDDALPGGRIYLDGIATDRDLAFRAYSSPDLFFALDAFRKTFAREWSGIPYATLIFLVPGLALGFSLGAKRASAAEIFARVSGMSLAMLSAASLVLLWLRAPVTWLGVVITGLAVLALARVVFARVVAHPSRNLGIALSPESRLAGVGWLGAFALLSLVVGFILVAELPAPLWVDSYVHASYTKEFLEQGHLPLYQFYHFGFHSIVALLIQLSGTTIPQAMLLVGQLIVTQIGLSFFLLGRRLTNSALAGLVSAICVWFLTPTPMYFLTWGRYPLLLGTALLPIALIGAMDLIDPPRLEPRAYLLAVITLMGLAFAHIRLLAFYVVFVAIYLVWRNLRARRWGASAGRVALLAITGFVIGMIWLASLATQHDVAQDIGARVAVVPGIDLPTAFAVMQSHHGPIVWAFAAVGVIVTLARQSRSALIVVAWFIALIALAALQRILIGVELLDVSFVVLMGFLPAALIVGELAHVLYQKFAEGIGKLDRLAWVVVSVSITLIGAREMLSIVNPTTILFTDADARAMTWIQAHTPPDARFLVNSFAWYPTDYIPSDGGSWIPYTTNRAIVFPSNVIAPDAIVRLIDARQVTHVYIGRRAGVLHASDFVDAPERYELVYEEAGVRIFRIR